MGADGDLAVITITASLVSSSSSSNTTVTAKATGILGISEGAKIFNLLSLPAMSPANHHIFACGSRKHGTPWSEPEDCFSRC